MLLQRAVVAASFAALALAAPTTTRCKALWDQAPKHLADLQVYVAQEYPGELSASPRLGHKLIFLSFQRAPTSPSQLVSYMLARKGKPDLILSSLSYQGVQLACSQPPCLLSLWSIHPHFERVCGEQRSLLCPFRAATKLSAQVRFEVWLPVEWNGRFAMVGNGGDAGGVNYPDMYGPIKNCEQQSLSA